MTKKKIKLDESNYTYLYKWDVKKPKAVLHVVHGSKEHILRYVPMIKYLNKQGIAVYGMDLRGHGVSSIEQDKFGHIESYKDLNNDIDKINTIIEKDYPGIKMVMYGHSMGSFVLRHYLSRNKDKDAIISGTNEQSVITTKVALFVLGLTKLFKGKQKFNKLIDSQSYKAFDKQMEPGVSWLSDDPLVVQEYDNDKMNPKKFTNESFTAMLSWLREIRKPKNYKEHKGKLLIISGGNDPVGNKGKGPKKVYKKYKKHGTDIKIILYKDGHHEIHNDKNKAVVYKDIKNFVLSK